MSTTLASAAMDCPRCGSVSDPGDLRCPVCSLALPPLAPVDFARDDVQAPRIEIVRCASCGAAMEYGVRVQDPHCAFCGSVVALERPEDPVEQTECYLPFTVDRRTATDVYRRWLSQQGFFRPSDLASDARLESLRALWWVGWTANADAVVTWTLDSNANAGRAGWAPHAGDLQTTFDHIVVPATRGLSSEECTRLIPSYDLSSGVDGPDGAETIDGTAVRERFVTSRSAARGQIVRAIQYLAVSRITDGKTAPGSRFRNVHAAVHLRGLRTRRLAFPAYVLAYRYRGRVFRTVISGQDPSCIIGETPRSFAKMLLLLALVVAGLAIGMLGLARLLVRALLG